MRAGKRRHYCLIQQPTAYEENAAGDRVEGGWTTKAQRWIDVDTDRTPDSESEISHVCEVPNDSITRTVDRSMRILWPREYNGTEEDRYLNIVSVADPMNRRRTLVLNCRENTEAETPIGGMLESRINR